MGLKFSKGINRTVILGMVDTMLANKDVNIPWLPDQVERLIYVSARPSAGAMRAESVAHACRAAGALAAAT